MYDVDIVDIFKVVIDIVIGYVDDDLMDGVGKVFGVDVVMCVKVFC